MAESIETQVEDLSRFLEHYRQRQLHPILWVGAGASAAAGYPTLGQIEGLLRAELPGVDLEGFALMDAYLAAWSKADLGWLLQQKLGQPRPFTPLHTAMARLAEAGVCPLLFTTNYDRLLENALGAAGVGFVVQTLQANLPLQALETVQLLKLHGDLGDWASVVLTAASYAEFARTYPLLQSQLTLNLRTRPLVFVGCSMRDPRLLDWLDALSVQERAGLYASRVLITTADWQALPQKTQDLLDSANIRAITVPDHASVAQVLVQVAERCAPATPTALAFTMTPEATDWTIVGPAPDSPPHRVPNPLSDREFLARLHALREASSRPLVLEAPQTRARQAALEALPASWAAR